MPYARYGETVEGVVAALHGMEDAIAQGLTREALQTAMVPGAARNALDCALWDLGGQAGRPAGLRTRGTSGSTTGHHRVHYFAGGARRDGARPPRRPPGAHC